MKAPYTVSKHFLRLNPVQIIPFTDNVAERVYVIPEYINVPVTKVDLLACASLLSTAQSQMGYGNIATSERDACMSALRENLRKIANHVEGVAMFDLTLLRSSGFHEVSQSRTPVVLAKATIRSIVSGFTGQSLVTVIAQKGSRGYAVRAAEVDENGNTGEYRIIVMRTSSRKVPVDNLVPGKMYAFQGCAQGGKDYQSPWSDPVMQRAV